MRAESPIQRLYSALLGRRRAVLAGFVVVVAVSAVGVVKLQPGHDVSVLVGTPELGRATALLSELGTLDTVMIDVSKPDASADELVALADELVARLQETELFSALVFRMDPQASARLGEVLISHRFALLPPPASFEPAMKVARRELMLPVSPHKALIYRDAAGHRAGLQGVSVSAAPFMLTDSSGGTLMSADRRHALILAQPLSRALDVTAGAALAAAIEDATPDGATVEVLGGHVFAAASAESIRRDVWLTVSATLLVVLLLFGVVFAHIGPVFGVTLPVVVGLVFAAGMLGLAGVQLHGIILGFGAIMVGVGIDYGAHLVMHLRADRDASPSDVVRRVAPSIVMGALTTLIAFVVLASSGISALQQLALFTGLGVTASFAVSLLVIPLLAGVVTRGRAPRPNTQAVELSRRRAIVVLGVAVAATLALAPGLGSVSFDGEVRNLDYQPPATKELEARFVDRYKHARFATLVVAEGDDVEQALQTNDRVAEILLRAEERRDIGAAMTLGSVLPSARKQRASIAAYDPEALRPGLVAAADAFDLNAEVFHPFFEDLKAARTGPPLTAEAYKGTPLAPAIRRMLISDGEGARVVSVVHMSDARGGGRDLPAAVSDALEALGNVTILSGPSLARAAVSSISAAMGRLAGLSLALVALLLLFYYRRVVPALYALGPVAVGFVWTWGLMGVLDIPFNVISVGAFALVAGIGVDYGIFMTDAEISRDPTHHATTRSAVLLAAVTTLAGFAALLLANSPVMWTLGFAVSVGVTTSLAVAVGVLPAAWRLLGPPVRPTCDACDQPLRRPLDRAAALQLVIVAGLAMWLALAWVTGAGATGGWRIGLVLLADLAWGAWAVRRLLAPRPACSACGA